MSPFHPRPAFQHVIPAVSQQTPCASALQDDVTLHAHLLTPQGIDLKIAVANGLGNAKKVVTALKGGEAKYDFVEVMACPGGCVGGGGQPRSTDKEILKKRQQALYDLDERLQIRRPHDNVFIQKLYAEFLGVPLGEKAHHLLHTHYVAGGPGGDE